MKFSTTLCVERMMQKPTKLDQLMIESQRYLDMEASISETNIRKCQACGLSKVRPYPHPVLGVGDFKAKVVVYGKNPGKQEGLHDTPFYKESVSGIFLDKYLTALGISRAEAFLSNVVYCTTPDDRSPDEGERLTCSYYKTVELQCLPYARIVLLLGNDAVKTILSPFVESILPAYGTIYYRKGFLGRESVVFLIPVLHPGSVVRDRAAYNLVVRQLTYIREKYIVEYDETSKVL